MTTLVTGGTGFIGHHVVERLAARGEAVRVLDLDEPKRPLPEGTDFRKGSVTDASAAASACEGVTTVIHLAANAHLWAPDWSVFERINHQGTLQMLRASRGAGVTRFVHGSSLTTMIGKGMKGASRLLTEETVLEESDMLGAYPLSKLRAEQAVLDANGPDMTTIACLPTLPMGPGDYGLTAPARMVLDLANGMIPAYLDCQHNIIHVEDAAEGFIRARDKGEPGTKIILGGDNLSMGEMIAALGRVTGAKMPSAKVPYWLALTAGLIQEKIADTITHKPPQAPLTGVRLAGRPVRFNTSRARTVLGLEPRPAEDALRDCVRWLMDEGLVKRALPGLSALAEEV